MHDGPLAIISTHCIQSLVERSWKDSAFLFPLSSSFLRGLGLDAQPFSELLTLAVAFTRWSIAQPLFQLSGLLHFHDLELIYFCYGLCIDGWPFDFLENYLLVWNRNDRWYGWLDRVPFCVAHMCLVLDARMCAWDLGGLVFALAMDVEKSDASWG